MFLIAILRGRGGQCLPKGSKAQLNPLLPPRVCSEPSTEIAPKGQAQRLCPHSPVQGARFRAGGSFPFVSLGFTFASSPDAAAPFPETFVLACRTPC